MCRPCRPICSAICDHTAVSKPDSVSICSRTADSGLLESRNERTVLRSSSCSSVKAKFIATAWRHGAAPANPDVYARVHMDAGRTTIGIRELRRELATMVRRAATGQRVTVSVDGRPTAMLGPVENSGDHTSTASLVAAGLLLPPRRDDEARDTAPIPVWAGVRLDRALREVRG